MFELHIKLVKISLHVILHVLILGAHLNKCFCLHFLSSDSVTECYVTVSQFVESAFHVIAFTKKLYFI
jgi:hypothetical protein